MEKYGTARQGTDDNITRRMSIARWIPKPTNTHSEYVTLLVFTLQQWLHVGVSMLQHTFIVSLVKIYPTVSYG